MYCAHDDSDLVRKEQFSKNGHILCLPLEIRLLVLALVHEYRLEVYNKISCYRDILELEGTLQLLQERREHFKKCVLLIRECNDLIQLHLDEMIKKRFAVILLTEIEGQSDHMTHSGKHVVVVIDECCGRRGVKALPIQLENLLLDSSHKLKVTCHGAALFAKHRVNPFQGNDFTEIELTVHGKRRIWWVSGEELV